MLTRGSNLSSKKKELTARDLVKRMVAATTIREFPLVASLVKLEKAIQGKLNSNRQSHDTDFRAGLVMPQIQTV